MRTPLLHALGRTHCPACMCCVGVVIVGQVSDTQALSVACPGVTDNTFCLMNDERPTTFLVLKMGVCITPNPRFSSRGSAPRPAGADVRLTLMVQFVRTARTTNCGAIRVISRNEIRACLEGGKTTAR